MSLPEKRRQGHWNQASQLSRDHSYKEKKNNKKSPCKTSSFPLVPLNEITSFSEEWGGAFKPFMCSDNKGEKKAFRIFTPSKVRIH